MSWAWKGKLSPSALPTAPRSLRGEDQSLWRQLPARHWLGRREAVSALALFGALARSPPGLVVR